MSRHPHRWRSVFWLWAVLLLLSPAVATPRETAPGDSGHADQYAAQKAALIGRFGNAVPHEWGETVPGVKTRLATNDKVVALTLDACGGPRGSGFDAGLLDFLEREQIPATLFVSGRWIEANRQAFARLAANPLFEIANHGLGHKPASTTGRVAFGLEGTRTVAELVDEIALGAARIAELTGRRPRFYRSGTAHYDEVAVQVADALGQQVIGFALSGDQGATRTRSAVREALLSLNGGEIVLLHMNHPEAGTRGGVMDAIPELQRRGFRFVSLADRPLR